ncbi:MAG TPA: hypothetical protein VID72_05075, partial [Ktedonobacterales bacterium]
MSAVSRWWKIHFLEAELGLALLLAAGFALWDLGLGGERAVNALLAGNRAAIYGTLASICGSLLGFTIAAISIILGYASSERLAIVRDSKHYATLWRVFVAAMRGLALATLVALAGLIVDRDAAPVPLVLCLCVGALMLAILRL